MKKANPGIVEKAQWGAVDSNTATRTKVVLTVPRIVIKPILFFGPPTFWYNVDNKKWLKAASMLKFYVRENMILGEMTAADFAVDPKVNSFRVMNDRVASIGFIIDVTELSR